MRVSIITIGDELLKGSTINTNAAFLGENLLRIGIIPTQSITVPDCPNAIIKALDYLLPSSDLIITSGGLGPTGDDLTRAIIAEHFGLRLVKDKNIAAGLEARWQKFKQESVPAKVLEQSFIPVQGEAFENEVGTAPGIWTELPENGKYLCMLPGPPLEQRPMVENHLLPKLEKQLTAPVYSKLYYVAHASESWVEETVSQLLVDTPEISAAYCASYEKVKLFLTCNNQELIDQKAKEVEQAFGDRLLHSGCSSLAEDVMLSLKKRNLVLATAESCTGGMIAAAMTDLPGSSEVFSGGVVAYSNEIKSNVLNVNTPLLETYGAVSEQCVTAMVENVCAKFHVETGIAVSGIAGPGGGSPEKPVGLVYIAVKVGPKVEVRKCNFSGNRDAVRKRTVATALYDLRQMLLAGKI